MISLNHSSPLAISLPAGGDSPKARAADGLISVATLLPALRASGETGRELAGALAGQPELAKPQGMLKPEDAGALHRWLSGKLDDRQFTAGIEQTMGKLELLIDKELKARGDEAKDPAFDISGMSTRMAALLAQAIVLMSALRTADIGISVDSAVDIAKEAADIILLEKSLMVLEEGVIEGRRVFANMLKYIKMTASSNFGNVFSVLVASAFLPFLPMLPMQLLVQNLLYDISQTAIPFDNVDSDLLAKPQRWNADDIGRFMIWFGPVSSIFDIITFVMMWHVFGANSIAHQSLFQSGWFVEGLLSQTLIVHMIRTRRVPFIQSRAAWPVVLTTLSVMAVGIFFAVGPFAYYFKLVTLPPLYFVALSAILLGYMALTQLMKGQYVRRYGWQ